MTESFAVADSFVPVPPDESWELDALAGALELADGFTLLFACCNQAGHRDRLMAALRAQLPLLRVQELPLREPVRSLLVELDDRLEFPPPVAVFVFGLEDWLPAGAEAERSPFVLNLNAARNYFSQVASCPVVLWLPQHLLAAIARGAPDFCSVRSGLYSFCATPQARERVAKTLTSQDWTAIAGLALGEKHERAKALAEMLAEYEALPEELRDPLAESRLMSSQSALLQILGDFKTAEPLIRRALATNEATLGPDHPSTAGSLNNLALLYQSLGRYAEAEPLIRRALAINEATLGPDHPSTAGSLNNLALLYKSQRRYAEAEPLIRRALAINEATLGPDHFSTAGSLNNLALLYKSQRRYAEAEPLIRRALAIKEASLGPDHPSMAASLNNLALLYKSLGRYAEAEPLHRRALAIREASLGPDHPSTAGSLNNLALLYKSQRRYAEAEPLIRRALAIREATLGPDHPSTAGSLNNLALLYKSQRRYAEAEPRRRRSLGVQQRGGAGAGPPPNHELPRES